MVNLHNNTDSREGIGSLIQECRVEAGWSQKELARQAGTTQAIVSYLENGKVDFKYDSLVKIADALGYDVEVGFRPRVSQDEVEWNEAFFEALMDASDRA